MQVTGSVLRVVVNCNHNDFDGFIKGNNAGSLVLFGELFAIIIIIIEKGY